MATTTLWHKSARSDESEGNLLTLARRQSLQALNVLDWTTLIGFSGTSVSALLSASLAFPVIESNAVVVAERLLELGHRSVVVAAANIWSLGDLCQGKAARVANLLKK